MKSKLTYEKKKLAKHPQICSEDRTYIDFLINGTSMADLLGGVGNNIGKFGWKSNVDFEIKEFNDFQKAKKSRLDNGLFSAYVCAECGDEGCGAVMFRIERNEDFVKWFNFVWSDGCLNDEDEKIKIEPIIFDRQEYDTALTKLKELIIEK